MTRFLATPLVALAATALFLALPGQSQASGISLSLSIGQPAVVRPVVAPYAPVGVVGSYYQPIHTCAPGPVVVRYPAPVVVNSPLYAPVVVRPALYPVVVPPPHHHHHHHHHQPYPYGR